MPALSSAGVHHVRRPRLDAFRQRVPPREQAGDEPTYPLHALVCDECLLVQLEALVSPDELFADYAYFSSYSDSWVEHARRLRPGGGRPTPAWVPTTWWSRSRATTGTC